MPQVPPRWREFLDALREDPRFDALHPILLESWRRTFESEFAEFPDPVQLHRVGRSELRSAVSLSRNLLDVAIPRIQSFSASLVAIKHVAFMTDRAGIVLYSTGTDQGLLSEGLVPGFDWSEERMSCNGAGTALATERPVVVLAPRQHNLPYRAACCFATPIQSPSGGVGAAVDLRAHIEDALPDYLWAVVDLGQKIEQDWERRGANAGNSQREGKRTVLVVAPDEANLKLRSLVLEHLGFRVLTSPDVASAAQLCSAEQVDCMIVDNDLQGAGCSELERYFLLQRPQVPMILMTSKDQPVPSGMFDYIVNKVEGPTRLLEVIRWVVHRKDRAQ